MLASAWPRVSWKCTAMRASGTGERSPRPAASGERRPCAYRVAERDLLAAQLVQSHGERGHPSGEIGAS
jgi:hypothetical protein